MNVKFYVVPFRFSSENAKYQHQSIALAEGFLSIGGINFFGNCDYWFQTELDNFLIKSAPKDFKPDIAIYESDFLIENIDHIGSFIDVSCVNVLLDNGDGDYGFSKSDIAKKFSLVLRSHFLNGIKYLKNVKPWAFGLTSRIINAIDRSENTKIQESVFVNIRVRQNMRILANEKLKPLLFSRFSINEQITENLSESFLAENPYHYWAQTGRRHDELFYKLLNSNLMTFAFCGISCKKYPILGMIFPTISRAFFNDERIAFRIINYDSWRFWESMYSNSCPIALNFEFWNFQLPVMPTEGKHYFGASDFKFEELANRIVDNSVDSIKLMGQEGKKWAKENYAPLPTAKRFIGLIKDNQAF